MFLKSTYFSFLFFLLALLPSSYAHAGVAPQLGVNGKPKRSDVKRPSNNQPCGNGVNIAAALDTSTAVPASTNGEVEVTVLNFNAGADGSRQVSAKVDPSGTGKNFEKMTITVNGDPVPKENTGSQEVVAKLPTGTKCAGGSKKNRCLVQFVTNRGFGNCVVVSQGPDAGIRSPSTSSDARADPEIGSNDIPDRAVDGSDSPARTDKKIGVRNEKRGNEKEEEPEDRKNEKNKVDNEGAKPGDKEGEKNKNKKKGAAKKSESDKGKGRGGKNNGGKRKQKKGGKKKQAGTRAPRALLADLKGAAES